MKVSEYRDLMSAAECALASAMSAADARERLVEGSRLVRAIREIRGAECPRKNLALECRANLMLERAETFLASSGIGELVRHADQADSSLQRMAYAGEWR